MPLAESCHRVAVDDEVRAHDTIITPLKSAAVVPMRATLASSTQHGDVDAVVSAAF